MTLAFEIEGVNANVLTNSLTLRHLWEGIHNATNLKIDFGLLPATCAGLPVSIHHGSVNCSHPVKYEHFATYIEVHPARMMIVGSKNLSEKQTECLTE